jgi:hypothetical protein
LGTPPECLLAAVTANGLKRRVSWFGPWVSIAMNTRNRPPDEFIVADLRASGGTFFGAGHFASSPAMMGKKIEVFWKGV